MGHARTANLWPIARPGIPDIPPSSPRSHAHPRPIIFGCNQNAHFAHYRISVPSKDAIYLPLAHLPLVPLVAPICMATGDGEQCARGSALEEAFAPFVPDPVTFQEKDRRAWHRATKRKFGRSEIASRRSCSSKRPLQARIVAVAMDVLRSFLAMDPSEPWERRVEC